jgi:hypothetical protein
MNNKILITIIYLTFASIAIGLIGLLTGNARFDILIETGAGLFLLTGVYLLIKNGDYLKTREFRLNGIGIAIIIIGAMFKIMHWPWVGIVLGIGYLSIIAFYLIYLIKKEKTNWMNWLKLSFITVLFTGKYFETFHFPYNEELSFLAILILGVLVIKFIKDNKPEKKNQSIYPD